MSLQNIRIVLVRPRGAANVGAVARAMKNMGVLDLVLVRPGPLKRYWTTAMAVHAADVVERARTVASLNEAVKDCAVVVGTTVRDGLYRSRARAPRAAAAELVEQVARQHVALVFGPEDHGLSNDDLKQCHQLLTIPASPEYPSLNLAQAVMVCVYEIYLAASARKIAGDALELAPAKRMEFLYERLQAAFLSIGFLHGDNPDHIMFALRRVFGRAGLEDRDVRILLGLARQIEWFAGGGWQEAERRRAAGRPVK